MCVTVVLLAYHMGGGGGRGGTLCLWKRMKADDLELILNLQITLKGAGGGGGHTLSLEEDVLW